MAKRFLSEGFVVVDHLSITGKNIYQIKTLNFAVLLANVNLCKSLRHIIEASEQRTMIVSFDSCV